MPKNCAIIGCNSLYSPGGKRQFFSFPLLRKQTNKQVAITQARQTAWLKALNRCDFFPSQYRSARVCDLHFISGKSACYTDVDDPDWVPSLNLGYKREPDVKTEEAIMEEEWIEADVNIEPEEWIEDDEYNTGDVPSLNETFVVDVSSKEGASDSVLTSSKGTQTSVSTSSKGTQMSARTSSKGTQMFIRSSSTGTQTDGTVTGMSDEVILSYKEQIQLLEEMLDKHNVKLSNFQGDDKKTNFFTGISNYATMEAIFEILQSKIPFSRKLSNFQIFFIVLSKLRLNLSFRYLSYQYEPVGICLHNIDCTQPLSYSLNACRDLYARKDCLVYELSLSMQ